MKRITGLLLLGAATALQAADDLPVLTVESTRLSDVSGEEVRSADLAEALAGAVPGISLVRRSGIANDIILRGQKKDNINILVDDTKVYGACVNRMDPPTSHVLTNTIEGIEVIEGPYDVQNFGTLSGAVRITTKKPARGLSGEAGLNFGSWGYRKGAATLTGGGDSVRFLVSASKETSDPYEDGDGNDFAEQIENLNPATAPAMSDPRYKAEYSGLDAYDKQTFMGKLYLDLADKHELRLGYTANRSDDVLYPSSKMDALYDDSDIFNAEYAVKGLGRYSKSLDVQYYDSRVEHPMSTLYRVSSGAGSVNERISFLSTRMQGLKIKDSFDLDDSAQVTLGIDFSRRNWDGTYTVKGPPAQAGWTGRKSIDDVDTDNRALFAEIEKRYSSFSIRAGARYDDTSIDPAGTLGQPSNDYNSLSGFVFASRELDSGTRIFGGVGKASRVPDARELYFRNVMSATADIGTPTLDDTDNVEIDLGMEYRFDSLSVRTKLFHSWLHDYIYYNADNSALNAFENIDATIYGLDVSGSWFMTDALYLDFGLAWQRGRKDQALAGQSDRDLAEIPPLKANLALNYDYGMKNSASAELVVADDWDDFDADNGEQSIDGYAVLNLKLRHALGRHLELTAGVDNVLDETYATTNTYKDLTLLLDTAGDVMLINEPGRYLYVNAVYRF